MNKAFNVVKMEMNRFSSSIFNSSSFLDKNKKKEQIDNLAPLLSANFTLLVAYMSPKMIKDLLYGLLESVTKLERI